MEHSKETTERLLLKNKLLFVCSILFIMSSLFLTCYLFFFRTITIDVTKHAQISYTGESGFASVSAVNADYNLNQRTQEFLNSITYQVSPNEHLENGMSITIRAKYDEGLAAKYHIRVINETKEILVSGLVERFAKPGDIDADFLNKLDETAKAYLKRNQDMILQTDFTQFQAGTERSYIGSDRKYRIFLKALDLSNKDKIVDVYMLYANGILTDGKDTATQTQEPVGIYYLMTYDDINQGRIMKDESVFGEGLAGLTFQSQTELIQWLHDRYGLSYQFMIME